MAWSSRFIRGPKTSMVKAQVADLAKRQDIKPEKVKAPAIERWTVHNMRHTVGTHMIEDLGSLARSSR